MLIEEKYYSLKRRPLRIVSVAEDAGGFSALTADIGIQRRVPRFLFEGLIYCFRCPLDRPQLFCCWSRGHLSLLLPLLRERLRLALGSILRLCCS